ncbi:Type I secretion outer membrane protein, TolC [Rhodospirillum rubrum ATCC 11170]|uniref:Type I secretion outer membrane protein, TolC n=2 Tax=Rhodospirillum rubrum TaxID=1085 RepID=Q2RTE7_RHORT|nr:Type I secretion outer membrane protein, TolC [Rhodospirillum rubrum ATCC 11170]MBK5954186.1 hypothetical protein [Rhodospirillum rubrum]
MFCVAPLWWSCILTKGEATPFLCDDLRLAVPFGARAERAPERTVFEAFREKLMIKPVSIAVASLLVAGLGLSSPVMAETFDEALVSAYQANPTLQARRALLRAVDEQVPQALSDWRPQVSVQGSTFYQQMDYEPGRKNLDNRPATLGVVLQQNIFRGLRTVAQTDQAKAQVQSERALLRSVEQTVLLNAAQAYFNVIRDQAVLELNINNEQVLRRQLDAANDRFRVGEITRTDVAQADSRLAGAIADRIQAEGTLESSRANYTQVVGHPPENIQPPPPYARLPQTLEDGLNTALSANPDVIAALYVWRQAQAAIRDQRGKLLPTLNAEVSYSFSHNPSATTEYDTKTFQAGLNLTVPLYQGGAVYSQIRDAKHRAGQRRLQVDEQREAVIESLTSAWETLTSARARVSSYKSQIEAAGIALDGVQREAQVGSRTVLDVLDAEQELLTSRVNLVRAERDSAISTYEVLAALGAMTAEDLGLNTPLYDATAHYNDVKGQWIGGNDLANQDEDLIVKTAPPIDGDSMTRPVRALDSATGTR